jgi:Fe-S-cluster containining protein
MKSVDLKNMSNLPGRKLGENEPFSFRCHPDLACFNQCCRNLNLFLYPYDVICLKQNLGMTSDAFLDHYVDVVLRPGNYFPAVLLRMADNEEKTCPFLTDEGCSVYPDRPDTCRTFPMEQGLVVDQGAKAPELIQFYRPPDFCLGQYEDAPMTAKTWAEDQEAETHHQMTVMWAGLKAMFQNDPWEGEGPDGPRGKMAFMATYNLDRFRDFIFNSSFLKRYKVKSSVLKSIRANDVQLMKFGMAWVKFYLWGIKSKNLRLK